MKTNLLIAALALAVLTPALAQYQAIGNDGIAASPKLRQALNERQAPAAAVTTVNTVTYANPKIFGSPKYLETWNKPIATRTPVATRDYALRANCTGTRILASPKMMDTMSKVASSQCCGMGSCVVACAR